MPNIQRPNKITESPRIAYSKIISGVLQAGFAIDSADRNATDDGWEVTTAVETSTGSGAVTTFLVSDSCYYQRTDLADQAKYAFSNYQVFLTSLGSTLRFIAI